ncbi:MAG: hypothetical protein JSW00_01030 [Thermoplasmata archaeon]|nr:MAG: hypothetical protein JSW00_01030 [Thermoplasmata archaeon]
MCRYSYGNGRCANIDVDVNFCVGEKNCNLSDILRSRAFRGQPQDNIWRPIPSNVWSDKMLLGSKKTKANYKIGTEFK